MKKLTILTTVILTANLLFAQINHIDTSFYSGALQETKMVDIYFPPGYDENPDTYYSVIYYLHGWFGSQNSMNEMISLMQSLINNGTIEPVIMVGADNSPDPFDGSMYMNSIIWGNYEDYMINDLTNWVESSFRAYPSRDHRALLGISMGGYGTFRFGILHKDKFRVLAAAASQILNLTEVVLDSTRLHVLQQNQPGPPFFYDYDNSGSASTTQFMFLVFGAFAPNLNTPQTYINPPIVEFPLDEYGEYIDTILMKAKNNSIDHLIHQLYPEDSVGIFFGCGSADASIYPCHIAFKDSLELLGLPYEFYDHTGGHIMPAGFKERALIFMDSLLSPPAIPPSTCLPEGITFTTQEQIDNFQINHPNCMEIEGDVTIYGDDITNLSGLNILTAIWGNLSVFDNEALISLTGLEGLSSIEGNITIHRNLALTNLIGLGNLTSISGDLIIGGLNSMMFYGNPSLSNLTGLDSLTFIGGNVTISDNDTLTNLTGLDSLTFIGGDVTIADNDALSSLDGLESLTSVGGGFQIGGYNFLNDESCGNDALTSLEGLVNLTSVGGYLDISANSSLTSLAGLGNLDSIGGFFQIAHSALTSMAELVNLNSIGGDLWIDYNEALISFMGLEGLSSIGGYIWVHSNNALTSLMGIENIEAVSIEHLEIGYNNSLSTCHVQSICNYLASPNGSVDIYDNAPGCNSSGEVQEACDSIVSVENRPLKNELSISPNPMNSYAIVSLNLSTPTPVEICIYKLTGICVKSWKYQAEAPGDHAYYLNLAELVPAVYFCKVLMGDRVVAKKIIKQ